MSKLAATVAVAASVNSGAAIDDPLKPTIVLVHGAFADSSSWNGVITHLQRDGYKTVAVANPLRSVSNDARLVSDVVRSIAGPVILVGHSYGGR